MLKALILLPVLAYGRSRTGCPAQTLDLVCPSGTEINIIKAMFGRFESDVCESAKTDLAPNKKCSLPVVHTKQAVAAKCNGKPSCSLLVDPTTFGADPCDDGTGYLTVEYDCEAVDFECPGIALDASSPRELYTQYSQEGGWATDPLDSESRVYFLPWDQSGATELKEFRNLESLVQNSQETHYRLDTRADGTGFVVRDRKLYYNKRQSRQIVMYDLERRFESRTVELPDANYYDTSPYSIDRNTDIDLAVDESGLWAIYATENNNGKIVLSQLDPSSLKVLQTFNTKFEKTMVAEAWMTCGILYAIEADTNTLLFMFDTVSGSHVDESIVNRLELQSFPAQTTSVKYDPKVRSLQVWHSGVAITYQLRFQPREILKPTTTTTTTTTKKTPRTTRSPKSCPPLTYWGLQFSIAAYGEESSAPCYESSGRAVLRCTGSSSRPYWTSSPDMSACMSGWVQKTSVEIVRSSVPQKFAENLLEKVTQNTVTLRVWDLKKILEFVDKLRQENPRDLDSGKLETTLLEIVSEIIPVIEKNKSSLDLRREAVAVVQRLLSRISCKLRANKLPFEVKFDNIETWLEPAELESESSKFPILLEFDQSAPSSSYKSLIKIGEEQWMGSLHTDCNEPVNWSVRYHFDRTVGCSEVQGNSCRHETNVETGNSICFCSRGSGPVSLAQGQISESYSEETIMIADGEISTVETMLMAVLVLAALLHAASGVASLLLPEASVVDVGGLNSAARAINFVMMVALVTISSTNGKMNAENSACSAISVFLHTMCLMTFCWCLVRPAYLAILCAHPLKNQPVGWWLHVACFGLPILITLGAAGTQMFPRADKLCFAGDSISFTWSAAGPAVIFASLSMLLILFSATRLRDNPDYQLHVQQIRSTLLWVGLLTVLLSCEWGLILLYYAQGSTGDSTVAIFLAAIAIFHAIASFIYHCLCNIKAQRGCKSVLTNFGLRDGEKSHGAEFFWSSAPLHSRADFQHTLRPVPDCVQMTYTTDESQLSALPKGSMADQSTLQLQYPASPAYHYPTHMIPAGINHPSQMIVNPSHLGHRSVYTPTGTVPKLSNNGNYPGLDPSRSEFEFRAGQSAHNLNSSNASNFRQPLLHGGDVEV